MTLQSGATCVPASSEQKRRCHSPFATAFVTEPIEEAGGMETVQPCLPGSGRRGAWGATGDRGDESVPGLTTAQLCEYTKDDQMVHFKGVNFYGVCCISIKLLFKKEGKT